MAVGESLGGGGAAITAKGLVGGTAAGDQATTAVADGCRGGRCRGGNLTIGVAAATRRATACPAMVKVILTVWLLPGFSTS